jgi:hypothetical protein
MFVEKPLKFHVERLHCSAEKKDSTDNVLRQTSFILLNFRIRSFIKFCSHYLLAVTPITPAFATGVKHHTGTVRLSNIENKLISKQFCTP